MIDGPIRLLVIEDDPQIQRFLADALETHGYMVEFAGEGIVGVRMISARQPDIVMVDLGLPDMSGLDVIRKLRTWFFRPIIVLSARSVETEKVIALDLGADDYITKPFDIGELLARLRVAQRHLVQTETDTVETRLKVGDVVLDIAARRVWLSGVDLHLTPTEYKLLVTLMRNRGKVLTHRQLLHEVWGSAQVDALQYVRIYMRALRSKIEPLPAKPRYLLTEVGVGYRFADVPASPDEGNSTQST